MMCFSYGSTQQHLRWIFIKAGVGNLGETTKSKLDIENVHPSLQDPLQSNSPKTHERALPD